MHQFGQLAVYEKGSNKLIGLCGLHHSDDGIEISYMFFPEFWGKGFAREAILASVDYGFNEWLAGQELNKTNVIEINKMAN